MHTASPAGEQLTIQFVPEIRGRQATPKHLHVCSVVLLHHIQGEAFQFLIFVTLIFAHMNLITPACFLA